MNTLFTSFLRLPCLLLLLFSCAKHVAGHDGSINVRVYNATNQLAVFDGYLAGNLESSEGSDIFTSDPGIGINSTVNGFPEQESLYLNVVQELLFWNGTEVTNTDENLTIDWPEREGQSPVETYSITAATGYQLGMRWGEYRPDRFGGWDAHGDYALASSTPEIGIYGVVLQIAAPGFVSSEPFLVPLIYDPAGTMGPNEVVTGTAALIDKISPLPTADFDRNTVVDEADLAIWQGGWAISHGAALVHGDATGDGKTDGSDLLAWQRQLTPQLSNSLATFVPEPTSIWLLGVAVIAAHLTSFSRRLVRVCS